MNTKLLLQLLEYLITLLISRFQLLVDLRSNLLQLRLVRLAYLLDMLQLIKGKQALMKKVYIK